MPTLVRENIFITQGDDFRWTFECDEVVVGDEVNAEVRLWASGPLLATFETEIDFDEQTVTVALPLDITAFIRRSGIYDVELVTSTTTTTIRSGKAILRPQVTTGPSPGVRHRRHGQIRYDFTTHGQLGLLRHKEI